MKSPSAPLSSTLLLRWPSNPHLKNSIAFLIQSPNVFCITQNSSRVRPVTAQDQLLSQLLSYCYEEIPWPRQGLIKGSIQLNGCLLTLSESQSSIIIVGRREVWCQMNSQATYILIHILRKKRRERERDRDRETQRETQRDRDRETETEKQIDA